MYIYHSLTGSSWIISASNSSLTVREVQKHQQINKSNLSIRLQNLEKEGSEGPSKGITKRHMELNWLFVQ